MRGRSGSSRPRRLFHDGLVEDERLGPSFGYSLEGMIDGAHHRLIVRDDGICVLEVNGEVVKVGRREDFRELFPELR